MEYTFFVKPKMRALELYSLGTTSHETFAIICLNNFLLFLALLVIKNVRFPRTSVPGLHFFVENDKLCTEVSILTQSCEMSISG